MNFFGSGEQKQQGPDPVVAATTELQMYTGTSVCVWVEQYVPCLLLVG
jgi:hypothetical protein